MMIAVEWIQINYKDQIRKFLTAKLSNQVVGSSVLGALPGCSDAFFVVSLYTHGLVGFGALSAVMLSTAGDEAFVMLAMLPAETVAVVLLLSIVFGVIGGFVAEWVAKKLKIRNTSNCVIEIHGEEGMHLSHFLREHVYKHILKKHIPKLFLWIFATLFIVELIVQNFDVATILPKNMLLLLGLAALVGIIPESGPHLIFLTLFAQGLIPFSVFFTNTLVQDGHGLLPLLSCSPKAAIQVKAYNVVFSLAVGLALFAAGI
jgi:hypothetical protein